MPAPARCSSSKLRSVARLDTCTAATRPTPLTPVTAKRVRVRDSDQLRYACDAKGCGATFERLITLNLHLKTHTVSDVYTRYVTEYINSSYNVFFHACHELAITTICEYYASRTCPWLPSQCSLLHQQG
jgi:hypothetical protein